MNSEGENPTNEREEDPSREDSGNSKEKNNNEHNKNQQGEVGDKSQEKGNDKETRGNEQEEEKEKDKKQPEGNHETSQNQQEDGNQESKNKQGGDKESQQEKGKNETSQNQKESDENEDSGSDMSRTFRADESEDSTNETTLRANSTDGSTDGQESDNQSYGSYNEEEEEDDEYNKLNEAFIEDSEEESDNDKTPPTEDNTYGYSSLEKTVTLKYPERDEPLDLSVELQPINITQISEEDPFVCDIVVRLKDACRETVYDTPIVTPTAEREAPYDDATPTSVFSQGQYTVRNLFDQSPPTSEDKKPQKDTHKSMDWESASSLGKQGTFTKDQASRKGTYTKDAPARKGTYTKDAPARKGTYTKDAPARKGTYTKDAPARKGTYTKDTPARDGTYTLKTPEMSEESETGGAGVFDFSPPSPFDVETLEDDVFYPSHVIPGPNDNKFDKYLKRKKFVEDLIKRHIILSDAESRSFINSPQPVHQTGGGGGTFTYDTIDKGGTYTAGKGGTYTAGKGGTYTAGKGGTYTAGKEGTDTAGKGGTYTLEAPGSTSMGTTQGTPPNRGGTFTKEAPPRKGTFIKDQPNRGGTSSRKTPTRMGTYTKDASARDGTYTLQTPEMSEESETGGAGVFDFSPPSPFDVETLEDEVFHPSHIIPGPDDNKFDQYLKRKKFIEDLKRRHIIPSDVESRSFINSPQPVYQTGGGGGTFTYDAMNKGGTYTAGKGGTYTAGKGGTFTHEAPGATSMGTTQGTPPKRRGTYTADGQKPGGTFTYDSQDRSSYTSIAPTRGSSVSSCDPATVSSLNRTIVFEEQEGQDRVELNLEMDPFKITASEDGQGYTCDMVLHLNRSPVHGTPDITPTFERSVPYEDATQKSVFTKGQYAARNLFGQEPSTPEDSTQEDRSIEWEAGSSGPRGTYTTGAPIKRGTVTIASKPNGGSFSSEKPARKGTFTTEKPRKGTFTTEKPRKGTFTTEKPRKGTFTPEKPSKGTYAMDSIGTPRGRLTYDQESSEGTYSDSGSWDENALTPPSPYSETLEDDVFYPSNVIPGPYDNKFDQYLNRKKFLEALKTRHILPSNSESSSFINSPQPGFQEGGGGRAGTFTLDSTGPRGTHTKGTARKGTYTQSPPTRGGTYTQKEPVRHGTYTQKKPVRHGTYTQK